jgi:hypothetical protein
MHQELRLLKKVPDWDKSEAKLQRAVDYLRQSANCVRPVDHNRRTRSVAVVQKYHCARTEVFEGCLGDSVGSSVPVVPRV